MDNQHFFLGIDVAKDDLVVAISETRTKSFKNTAQGVSKLVRWTGGVCGDRLPWFVMEASGAYSVRPATQLFSNHEARVSVVNPGRVKAHGKAIGNR